MLLAMMGGALPHEEQISWQSFVVLSMPSRGQLHVAIIRSTVESDWCLEPVIDVVLNMIRDGRNEVPVGQRVNLESCLGIHRNVRCKVCHPTIVPDMMSPAGD